MLATVVILSHALLMRTRLVRSCSIYLEIRSPVGAQVDEHTAACKSDLLHKDVTTSHQGRTVTDVLLNRGLETS